MRISAKHHFLFFILSACAPMEKTMTPSLAIVTTCQNDRAHVLHEKARDVTFPLTQETKDLIAGMKNLASDTLHAAGLAAPQVGAGVRVIVYQVTEESLKIREDAREVVPLTALINPTYEAIPDSGTTHDWEFCFSVLDQGGKVYRPTSIQYSGYREDGTFVEAVAHGFLARLLQHEIDHVNGLLCSRLYPAGGFYGERDVMFDIRKKEIEEKKTVQSLS